MKKLISRGQHTWELPPPQVTADFQEKIFQLNILLESGRQFEALDLCARLVVSYPHSAGLLGILASLSDKGDDLPMAIVAGNLALQLFRSEIPATFKLGVDHLPGYLEGNRPLLSIARFLCDLYEETDNLRNCRELGEWLLKIDPSDEFGLRALLPKIYMEEKNTIAMHRLRRDYPNDYTPEILCGVLFMAIVNGDKANADKYWIQLQAEFPLIAKELLKKRHRAPKGYEAGVAYFADTAENAWAYWDFYGQLWLENERTAAFLQQKREKK